MRYIIYIYESVLQHRPDNVYGNTGHSLMHAKIDNIAHIDVVPERRGIWSLEASHGNHFIQEVTG
jgi:hypothetical protein